MISGDFMDATVLFEDKDIIVCIKPCGVLSQSDEQGRENMIDILRSQTKSEIFPLHRLDREVGGVMVFAKTKTAAAVLSRDIAENKLKKEYIALVHGVPDELKGEMRDLLFKDSRKNKSFVVKNKRKGVKEALLEYNVVNSVSIENECYSVVRVLLHTGRTHQIRVQFASRKMPLAGDRKYGGKDTFKDIGLWSYRLTFNHPVTRQQMQYSAEPENFIKEYMI